MDPMGNVFFRFWKRQESPEDHAIDEETMEQLATLVKFEWWIVCVCVWHYF